MCVQHICNCKQYSHINNRSTDTNNYHKNKSEKKNDKIQNEKFLYHAYFDSSIHERCLDSIICCSIAFCNAIWLLHVVIQLRIKRRIARSRNVLRVGTCSCKMAGARAIA